MLCVIRAQDFSRLYLTIPGNCWLFAARAIGVAQCKLQKDLKLENKLHKEQCLGHGGHLTNTHCVIEHSLNHG